MKYTYVIIEDEPIVRRGTELKMKRTGLPFALIGEAENGAAGLELIRRLNPNLAIVDMRMPDMDGAALMDEVRKESLPVELIVASGYSDFEYARAGIRSGACEYLVKPFSEDELRQAALVAIKNIESRGEASGAPASRALAQDTLRQSELRLISGYVAGVPDRNRSPEFHVLRIDPERGRYVVIEAVYSAAPKPLPKPDELSELITLDAPNLPGHVFYICYCLGGIPSGALDVIALRLKSADSAGISEVCRDLDRLYVARRQAQEARRDHPMGVKGIVSAYRPPAPPDSIEPELRDRLLFALESGDSDWFGKLALSYCDKCAHLGWSVNRLARALRAFFSSAIDHMAARSNGELPTLFQFDYLSQRTGDDDELPGLLISFMAHSFTPQKTASVGDTITRLRAYLDAHYCEDLSLERVSQLFGISPNYLSQLFSQRMGVSYVNYITELRIAQAKALLLNQRLDSAEIARRCGFGDVKYFYRVFKRQTGQTPNSFRQTNMR